MMTVDDMKSHQISMTNIRRLWEGLHGHEFIEDFDHAPITNRSDLPVIHPGGRGDLTVMDRENALIAKLEEDMYAQSSKRPREALWKTWCSMAQAWRLPPIPLTEELIVKVGASFKAGHYKSPQNYYFSRALQEHRALTKQHPSLFIQSLIRNVIRSITRGAGPTPFKGSFEVELFNRHEFHRGDEHSDLLVGRPRQCPRCYTHLLLVYTAWDRSCSSHDSPRVEPTDTR